MFDRKKFEQIRKVIRKLKFQNFLKLYFLVFFDVWFQEPLRSAKKFWFEKWFLDFFSKIVWFFGNCFFRKSSYSHYFKIILENLIYFSLFILISGTLEERSAACTVISHLDSDKLRAPLVEKLVHLAWDDQQEKVRLAAIAALGRTGRLDYSKISKMV